MKTVWCVFYDPGEWDTDRQLMWVCEDEATARDRIQRIAKASIRYRYDIEEFEVYGADD